MEQIPDRRHDEDMRGVIDQAMEFKRTLGQSFAVSFLVEHHIPPTVLHRVLIQATETGTATQ